MRIAALILVFAIILAMICSVIPTVSATALLVHDDSDSEKCTVKTSSGKELDLSPLSPVSFVATVYDKHSKHKELAKSYAFFIDLCKKQKFVPKWVSSKDACDHPSEAYIMRYDAWNNGKKSCKNSFAENMSIEWHKDHIAVDVVDNYRQAGLHLKIHCNPSAGDKIHHVTNVSHTAPEEMMPLDMYRFEAVSKLVC